MKIIQKLKFYFNKRSCEWTVWLPILGLITMSIYVKYRRYRTIYYVGLIWGPYQFHCLLLLLFLII